MPHAADGRTGHDESFGALFAQSDSAQPAGRTLPHDMESLSHAPAAGWEEQARATDAPIETDSESEFEVAQEITSHTEASLRRDGSEDHPSDARAEIGAAMIGSLASDMRSPAEVRRNETVLASGHPVIDDFAHRAAPIENSGDKQMAGTEPSLRKNLVKSGNVLGIAPGEAKAVAREGDKPPVPELPRNASEGTIPTRTATQPAADAPIRATPEATGLHPSRSTRGDPESKPRESVQASTTVALMPATATKTPSAPMAESVLRARLSEMPFSTFGSTEGQVARSIDGMLSGFGFALGEPATASSIFEVSGSRVLRAADFASAEAAREIAQQIGARITPLARGQFEMTLAPAELGRLEIALREVDGVMTLSVSAERPETLDLIRRHIDLLAQELRQIAQRELSLHVGTDSSGGKRTDPNSIHHASDTAHASADESETPRTASPVKPRDHLDLRL